MSPFVERLGQIGLDLVASMTRDHDGLGSQVTCHATSPWLFEAV
jgi:hypothetical protein